MTSASLTSSPSKLAIGVGIVNCIIHAIRLALAMAAYDRAAIFFRRQALPASIPGAFFHDRGQMDALDRADLGETGAAHHEPGRFGTFCNGLFLLRHGDTVACSGTVGRLRIGFVPERRGARAASESFRFVEKSMKREAPASPPLPPSPCCCTLLPA